MQQENIPSFIISSFFLVPSIFMIKHFQRKYRQVTQQSDKLRHAKMVAENNKIDYQALRNKKIDSIQVVFAKQFINSSEIKPQTLTIFKRQQNRGYINESEYYQNLSGGSIKIDSQKQPIVCEINDCLVMSSVLNPKTTTKSIFNKSEQIYQSFKATLFNVGSYCLAGHLMYNIQRKQFVLDTNFITLNFKQLIDYWQMKEGLSFLGVLGFSIIGTIATYYMMPGFVDISLKLKNQIKIWLGYAQQIAERQEYDYFKNLRISARPKDDMKCLYCNQKTAQLILECGHLIQCSNCHKRIKQQRNQQIYCYLCHKLSNIETKIYIS